MKDNGVCLNINFNTADDLKEVKQLYGEKNISCWEHFKWEFNRRLARISNQNEGKKEVSENQKTVIKENSDFTDKDVVELCLDINPNTNLIQLIYLSIYL